MVQFGMAPAPLGLGEQESFFRPPPILPLYPPDSTLSMLPSARLSQAFALASTTLSERASSNPREALTDVDRRNICEYAENHPEVKQADIGSKTIIYHQKISN